MSWGDEGAIARALSTLDRKRNVSVHAYETAFIIIFIPMSRNASTNELYFVTLTVIDWVDVFTRREYNDLIIKNLAWCQQHKKLNIYAYVIMTNHIHMVANVEDGSLGDVLGHFKTFTSKELVKMIRDNPLESRREWMIKLFERAGKQNPLNENHQFWQNGNHPVLLYSPAVIDQKIYYIHENPVRLRGGGARVLV